MGHSSREFYKPQWTIDSQVHSARLYMLKLFSSVMLCLVLLWLAISASYRDLYMLLMEADIKWRMYMYINVSNTKGVKGFI